MILKPRIPPLAEVPDDTKISIVIPIYEKSVKLKRTLWSIASTLDLEAQLVIAEGKLPVAQNRRRGLSEAEHDLVVMLDDDILLPPFWASCFANLILNIADLGAVGPKMTNPDGTPQNKIGVAGDDKMIEALIPGTMFMYSKSRCEGCEFDTEYKASQWEDHDFMQQVRKKGLKTIAYTGIWILHEGAWDGVVTPEWEANKAHYESKWGATDTVNYKRNRSL